MYPHFSFLGVSSLALGLVFVASSRLTETRMLTVLDCVFNSPPPPAPRPPPLVPDGVNVQRAQHGVDRPPTWREEEADIQAEAAARQAAGRRSQGGWVGGCCYVA